MNKQVRVNIRTLVNSSAIRRETRDGREHIIVPSATLPDGVVMNKIRYPAEAIEASFKGLEGTPAPLGHPTINGEFVSASDPRGMVRGFVGAWNENVRRENGRVFMDKVIDVEYASQLEGGQRILNAIEKGKPIHTSTGLYGLMKPLENADDGAQYEISEMVFDHDAILLDEPGAAKPEQGVGMLVNKAVNLSGDAVEVVNSALDDAERELDWAADHLLRAAERYQRVPLLERIKQLVKDAVTGGSAPEMSTNEEDMSMDKAQIDALNGKLDQLANSMANMGATVADALATALKPMTDALNAQAVANAAAEAAKKEALVNKVVEAGLLSKELAEASAVEVLNALAAQVQAPKVGYRLNSAAPAASQTNDMVAAYKLPKAE